MGHEPKQKRDAHRDARRERDPLMYAGRWLHRAAQSWQVFAVCAVLVTMMGLYRTVQLHTAGQTFASPDHTARIISAWKARNDGDLSCHNTAWSARVAFMQMGDGADRLEHLSCTRGGAGAAEGACGCAMKVSYPCARSVRTGASLGRLSTSMWRFTEARGMFRAFALRGVRLLREACR